MSTIEGVRGYSDLKIENAPMIISALETYKEGLVEVLDKVKNVDIGTYNAGFHGAVQISNVRAFVDNSITEMNKMADFIDGFIEGVKTAQSNYMQQASSVNINEVAAATVANADNVSGVQPFSDI